MFPCRNRAVGVVVFVVLTLIGQRAAFAQGEEMSVGVRGGVNISTLKFLADRRHHHGLEPDGFLAGIYDERPARWRARASGRSPLQPEGHDHPRRSEVRRRHRHPHRLPRRAGASQVSIRLVGTKAFEVHAGPVFMVRLNDRQKIGSTVLADFEKQALTTTDAGFSFGGAMSFDRLCVDVRYIWGSQNSTTTSTATNWRPGTGRSACPWAGG